MTKIWIRIMMTVAIMFATYAFESAIMPPILVKAVTSGK